MLPKYVIDYEVFLRPAEKSEKETALERMSRATENACLKKAEEELNQLRCQGLVPITMQPELYFWLEMGTQTVHCLGTGIKLKYINGIPQNLLPYQDLLSFYYDIPREALCYVFQFIFFYLSACKFTPYHQVLMKLKCRMNCLSIPLFEQICNIWVVDGILCYVNNCKRYIPITQEFLLQYVEDYFSYNNTIVKESDKNFALQQSLTRELKKIIPQERCITSNDLPHIEYLYMGSPMRARYISTLGRTVLEHERGPSGLPTKRIFVETNLTCCGLTNHLKEFLHLLSNENTETLEAICELFARILSSGLPSRYIWIICGSRASIEFFLVLLLTITNGENCEGVYALKQQSDALSTLEANLNRVFFYYNFKPDQDISSLNHSRLLKLVSGEPFLDIDDPFITTKIATRTVLLYATTRNEEEIMPELKRLPYKILRLGNEIEGFRLDATERDWLRTKLAFYGLTLLERDQVAFYGKSKKDHSENLLTELIKSFARQFCQADPGKYVTNKELYSWFKKYIESLPNPPKIPGSTSFKNVVCDVLHLECNVKRGAGNLMAYQDFTLDTKRCQEQIEKNLQEKAPLEAQLLQSNFDNILEKIDQILLIPSQNDR